MHEDRRSEARERALSLLYEAQAKNRATSDVLAALPVEPDSRAVALVEGVTARREEIDALLTRHARNWTLDRMPIIDLTVMRIAVFELLEQADVPTAVVIDEAVELAKRFSTEDSGRYVNGVLSAVARETRPSEASE